MIGERCQYGRCKDSRILAPQYFAASNDLMSLYNVTIVHVIDMGEHTQTPTLIHKTVNVEWI